MRVNCEPTVMNSRPIRVFGAFYEVNRAVICILALAGYTPCISKGQIPLRYLVADRFEAGRRPAASWNLA